MALFLLPKDLSECKKQYGSNEESHNIAANVAGLLLWGIVAVSAPAQNLIKETNFYFKSKTD